MALSVQQPELFERQEPLPAGFIYRQEFLSLAEEISLLKAIRALPLKEMKYREFTAKRRTMSFGSTYDFSKQARLPAPPLPEFLQPLRQKVAEWIGKAPEEFEHALVTEYQPGTALGWHRDLPHFETIVGVSLEGPCRMLFRSFQINKSSKMNLFSLDLQPRSAYVLQDEIRWGWQHSISPTKHLRYSVTFRTPRQA